MPNELSNAQFNGVNSNRALEPRGCRVTLPLVVVPAVLVLKISAFVTARTRCTVVDEAASSGVGVPPARVSADAAPAVPTDGEGEGVLIAKSRAITA